LRWTPGRWREERRWHRGATESHSTVLPDAQRGVRGGLARRRDAAQNIGAIGDGGRHQTRTRRRRRNMLGPASVWSSRRWKRGRREEDGPRDGEAGVGGRGIRGHRRVARSSGLAGAALADGDGGAGLRRGAPDSNGAVGMERAVDFGSGRQPMLSATWRRGGGRGAHAAARAAALCSDALRQRGVAALDRGVRTRGRSTGRTRASRTRGAFMVRRDSSAAPGSQFGCGVWQLSH
jgi:hypothetical protein